MTAAIAATKQSLINHKSMSTRRLDFMSFLMGDDGREDRPISEQALPPYKSKTR
jgi:hypothetical protein